MVICVWWLKMKMFHLVQHMSLTRFSANIKGFILPPSKQLIPTHSTSMPQCLTEIGAAAG